MTNIHTYCCCGQEVCRSYSNDSLVYFNYIKLRVGFFSEKYNKDSRGWIFLLSGTMKVKFADREFFVRAGEMCIFSHKNCAVECLSEVELILFKSDHLTEYCIRILQDLSISENNEEDCLKILPIESPLDKFLELTLKCLQEGINCKYWFEEKQQELFMILRMCYSGEELSRFLSLLTEHREMDLKKFIIANSVKAKNVQDLATMCGYSVNEFKRIFREMFNEPVYKWILQQKANQLKIKLADKDVNFKVIIDEFGFSSPAHFTKFCKQWLGMAPTQFIKLQRETLNY